MHVAGGETKSYRSHFRRDWPCGLVFPNLWPHRLTLGSWSLIGWPSDQFDGMAGVVSSIGEVSADGHVMSHVWERQFLFDIARVELLFRPGPGYRDQQWAWIFTHSVKVGFALLRSTDYLFYNSAGEWRVTYPMRPGTWTLETAGQFSTVENVGTACLVEMYASIWDEIPEEERFN